MALPEYQYAVVPIIAALKISISVSDSSVYKTALGVVLLQPAVRIEPLLRSDAPRADNEQGRAPTRQLLGTR